MGSKIDQNIEEALTLCLNTVQALVRGLGGRGVLNNCLYGEAPPRGPTLTLSYTIFHEKGIPFAFGIPFTD